MGNAASKLLCFWESWADHARGVHLVWKFYWKRPPRNEWASKTGPNTGVACWERSAQAHTYPLTPYHATCLNASLTPPPRASAVSRTVPPLFLPFGAARLINSSCDWPSPLPCLESRASHWGAWGATEQDEEAIGSWQQLGEAWKHARGARGACRAARLMPSPPLKPGSSHPPASSPFPLSVQIPEPIRQTINPPSSIDSLPHSPSLRAILQPANTTWPNFN